MRRKVVLGQGEQPLQRDHGIAGGTKVERDEVGLATRKHRDRGRSCAEVATVIQFGERRLDGAVAAVDDQQLGLDPRDRRHRLADLMGALDLIMKDVDVLGAKGADPR